MTEERDIYHRKTSVEKLATVVKSSVLSTVGFEAGALLLFASAGAFDNANRPLVSGGSIPNEPILEDATPDQVDKALRLTIGCFSVMATAAKLGAFVEVEQLRPVIAVYETILLLAFTTLYSLEEFVG